jgi:hypothetical protein
VGADPEGAGQKPLALEGNACAVLGVLGGVSRGARGVARLGIGGRSFRLGRGGCACFTAPWLLSGSGSCAFGRREFYGAMRTLLEVGAVHERQSRAEVCRSALGRLEGHGRAHELEYVNLVAGFRQPGTGSLPRCWFLEDPNLVAGFWVLSGSSRGSSSSPSTSTARRRCDRPELCVSPD